MQRQDEAEPRPPRCTVMRLLACEPVFSVGYGQHLYVFSEKWYEMVCQYAYEYIYIYMYIGVLANSTHHAS